MRDDDLTHEDVTADYPLVPTRCERCDRIFTACFREEVLCEECESNTGGAPDTPTSMDPSPEGNEVSEREPARRLHSA